MWTIRPYSSGLSDFKLPVACFKGQRAGSRQHKPPPVSSLVGSSNEAGIEVEGIKCNALINTGSMVSTISHSFSLKTKLIVYPLQDLIHVEGAWGQHIQYLGYVKSSITLPELNTIFDVLFLVVPDTMYHERVPVLIGTNVLSAGFSESVGSEERLSSPWRSRRSRRSEEIRRQSR